MPGTIVYPMHYLLVDKRGGTWNFHFGDEVFYNPRNVPVPSTLEDLLHRFNLTPKKIMIELFRIGVGKDGYYLVNLRKKTYHYCGLDWEDVRTTLQSLGIGRADPVES